MPDSASRLATAPPIETTRGSARRLPDPAGLNRDGLTVLAELRATQPNIPIAVLTGIPLSDAEELLAHSYSATVLYKPQTLDRILSFLAIHLNDTPIQPLSD